MPAMPNMNAQPAMPSMTAQPVMPNMNAQPVTPNMSSQPAYQSDYTNYQQVQPAVQQASPSLDNLPGNPQVVAPVSGPTMYDVGTMRSDGNEWLEYPVGSGAWYMRDATSRQWIRKI